MSSTVAGGGYCTADDVCRPFPQFQRGVAGSISDDDIQNWILNRKARIRSVMLSRQKYDPDTATLTTDQAAFLRSLNQLGSSADLGRALQGTVTLQPGEYSVPAADGRTFEAILKEIQAGVHDALFQPTISRSTDVQPLFKGTGGAEVDPLQTPATAYQTRFFGRSQVF